MFAVYHHARGPSVKTEKHRRKRTAEEEEGKIRNFSPASSSARISVVTNDLLEWFQINKRDLPWRKKRNSYRVWLSEAMLQQTQVATVIPYFEKWLKKFPTVQSLANAPLDDVLKQWEGLGYYRRARNLHKAAQVITNERKGIFPETYEDWLELPGIGPYTAAAISSIINGAKVLVVDGNVKRVAARLFTIKGDINEKVAKGKLELFLPEDKPGDFNEALMELGATICTPRNPKCLFCPVNTFCKAFQTGKVDKFPTPKVKKQIPHHHKYALVCIKNNALWLRQRGDNEMLNGLWGFMLVDDLPKKAKPLENVSHAYTHFRLTVTPVVSEIPKNTAGQFISLKNIDSLALSTLDYKVLEVLNKDQSRIFNL
jgi:A/G-specific adenine glycosylase